MAINQARQQNNGNIIPFSGRKVRSFFLKSFDIRLLMVMGGLIVFGLIMILSASSYSAMNSGLAVDYYFRHQLVAECIGFAAFVVITFIPYRWYNYIWLIGVEGILACLFPLMVLIWGHAKNGANRWVYLPGGVSFQPSEASKLLAILFVAGVLNWFADYLDRAFPYVIIYVFTAVVSLILIKVTNNLSAALIIFAIVFVMCFVSCRDLKIHLGLVGAGIVGAAGLLAYVGSKEISYFEDNFRLLRIANWIHLEDSNDDGVHQTLQSLYAIGNGGVLGKGAGQSVQKMGNLPEPYNDMIFSVLCEELGMVGSIALIVLFGLFLYEIYLVAMKTRKRYGFTIVTGVLVHMGVQIIMNIAVATAMMPNTGVSLPFISYGGTSAVFLMCEIGLVFAVNRNNNLEGSQ